MLFAKVNAMRRLSGLVIHFVTRPLLVETNLLSVLLGVGSLGFSRLLR